MAALAKLRRGPFAFLLESAPAGGESWSRYTFMGSEPRGAWRLEGPQFLGQIINHFVADPRNPAVMLMAASTGHLGPTIMRSTGIPVDLDTTLA